MKPIVRETTLAVITLLPTVALLLLWDAIPASIPLHYGFDGSVDNVGSRTTLLWAIPFSTVTTYLVLLLAPMIDPKKRLYFTDYRFYTVRLVIMTFLSVILLSYLFTLVGQWDFIRSLPLILMAFIVVLGNYFPVIRPNYFIGIRTPWTLENKEVWTRTHRFSGSLWMAGGVIGFLALLIWPHWALPAAAGLVLALALSSVIYSYVIYKQLKTGK